MTRGVKKLGYQKRVSMPCATVKMSQTMDSRRTSVGPNRKLVKISEHTNSTTSNLFTRKTSAAVSRPASNQHYPPLNEPSYICRLSSQPSPRQLLTQMNEPTHPQSMMKTSFVLDSINFVKPGIGKFKTNMNSKKLFFTRK